MYRQTRGSALQVVLNLILLAALQASVWAIIYMMLAIHEPGASAATGQPAASQQEAVAYETRMAVLRAQAVK
jgi:hypothetical protein